MDVHPSDRLSLWSNDRVGDEYMEEKENRIVGNKFLPLRCLRKRRNYNYSKMKLDNSFLKENFVKILTFPSNLLKSLS